MSKRHDVLMHYILGLILEVGTIAAFSLGAWRVSRGAWRLPVVIVVFVLSLSIWSLFLMRHASKRLPMPMLAVCTLALSIGAVTTLFLTHFEILSMALGLFALFDLTLLVALWWWHPEVLVRITSAAGSKPARRSMERNLDDPGRRRMPQQSKPRRYGTSAVESRRPSGRRR